VILKFYKFWYSFYIYKQKESLNIFFRAQSTFLKTRAALGFGRLCSKKKHIMLLAVLYFLQIMPKLCYFLKIMLSVTEIMLLRFYTDFKENKDHQ